MSWSAKTFRRNYLNSFKGPFGIDASKLAFVSMAKLAFVSMAKLAFVMASKIALISYELLPCFFSLLGSCMLVLMFEKFSGPRLLGFS